MLGFSALGFLPLGFIIITPVITAGGAGVFFTGADRLEISIGNAGGSIVNGPDPLIVNVTKGGMVTFTSGAGLVVSDA